MWLAVATALMFAAISCRTAATPEIPQQESVPSVSAEPQQLQADTVAPAPPGLVIVASSEGQSLTLVDSATNLVSKTVPSGISVGRVSIAPDGRTAWFFSTQPGNSDVYFMDLPDGLSRGNARLGSAPYAVAFSPDGGRAFVAMKDGGSVSFLDAGSRSAYGQVSLGEQPSGVLVRRDLRDIAFAPGQQGGLLYVAGYGSGVIWVIDASTGRPLPPIETGGAPMLVLADPAAPIAYGFIDILNQIVVVDTANQQIVRRIDLPGKPEGAAISPDSQIFVTTAGSDQVWSIRATTDSTLSGIDVGTQPAGIAISTDGARAYVANRGDGTLSVIDIPTSQTVETVQLDKTPVAVAFAPATDQASPTGPAADMQAASPTPALTVNAPQAGPSVSDRLPEGAVKETFVPGASFPSAMAFAPDGRLFYGEVRTGRIRIVENGVLLPDPFFDFTVAGEAETGLLGLAVDPDFEANHYIYVFYTEAGGAEPRDGSANGPNHVVRLTDVDGKGNDLTPIVPDLPSGPFHDGGSLRFGPDGKLYITLGETGHMELAQDLASPGGKILRVNPDGTVPEDNPFAAQPDKSGMIWAYGFRNPFDLDFHPVTGVLITGENGPGDNDEMDVVTRAGNYGWPPAGFQNKPEIVDPISVLNPPVAPTGVAFYKSDQIPEWQNDLFYCNFHRGELRRVHLAPLTTDRIASEEVVTSGCTLRIATGPDGALYYSDINAIYRIRNAGTPGLPAVKTAAAGSVAASPTPALPSGLRPEDRDVNVTMTEWKFELSRTTLPAGKIRFVVENIGSTIHAMEITGNNIDINTGDMAPGASRQIEIELPAGTYRLFCPVGNHAGQGMDLNITVVGP